MSIEITNKEFAIKVIAALHAQGLVNAATYYNVLKKYACAA